MQDFFISYNWADEPWARMLGDWLDQAGYTTVFQQQDFVPATNFAAEMHRALQSMKRMIMVLSPDYLTAKFPLAEWTAAFATDPACESGTLIPVRVRDCQPDGLLRPIVYIDLVELNTQDARKVFLDGIGSVIRRKAPSKPQRKAPRPPATPKKRPLNQKIAGHHNTNIQAGKVTNLTIKTGSKKAPSIQPIDVVGANVEMRAYIEYLVGRYIEWRQAGISKGIDKRRFHPSMIHRDIKRDFGARTYLVPQSRFHDLVNYLQIRINDTIIGRNSKHRNFHSYEEHLAILHGKHKSKQIRPNAVEPTSLSEAIVSTARVWSTARQKAQANKCINNLRQIDGATQQWALEHGKSDQAAPMVSDLAPYFKGGFIPGCPLGGAYSLCNSSGSPTCSIPNHTL